MLTGVAGLVGLTMQNVQMPEAETYKPETSAVIVQDDSVEVHTDVSQRGFLPAQSVVCEPSNNE
jgi:hypothetical protein